MKVSKEVMTAREDAILPVLKGMLRSAEGHPGFYRWANPDMTDVQAASIFVTMTGDKAITAGVVAGLRNRNGWTFYSHPKPPAKVNGPNKEVLVPSEDRIADIHGSIQLLAQEMAHSNRLTAVAFDGFQKNAIETMTARFGALEKAYNAFLKKFEEADEDYGNLLARCERLEVALKLSSVGQVKPLNGGHATPR